MSLLTTAERALMRFALLDLPGTPGSPGGSDAPPKLDPVKLVLGASVPVKAVIVVLAVFSLACWIVIGAKALHLRRARRESEDFLRVFDRSGTFDAVANGLAEFRGSPFARIFAVGYDEMSRFTRGERVPLSDPQSTHIESATRRAAAKEISHLE
jgi:biopolymer transport protein TolQ